MGTSTSSAALVNVLSRLKGVRCSGDGHVALCPAHDDREASLSVGLGEDGRALLNCHLGCALDDICRAIGITAADLFEQSARTKSRKRIVATYDDQDADGTLLYQAVRYQPKGFKQRRPDGCGKWKWSLKSVKRVLYQLPKLAAADPDDRIFVSEGEKDCDNLAKLGLLATTCPQGAGKWKHLSDDSVLERHSVVIIADKDVAGRKHSRDVAQRLYGRTREIRILELPGDGNDVSDWLAAGGTKEEFIALAESAPLFEPQTEDVQEAEEKRSQATGLVDICENVQLFHHDDVAFVTLVIDGHIETLPLNGRMFKRWLARQFYLAEGRVPSTQAKTDALGVLEGKALFGGPEITVHTRIAEHEGRIFLDLADPDRNVIEIGPNGWRVCGDVPVRFRRPRGMLPLPMPVPGGSLEELKQFINFESERLFVLVVSWLVGAFRPRRPIPVLVLVSEHGSGKSTATRVLRMLIDPNEAPIRCEPREVRDLMIAANNSWMIAFDNLSSVPTWLSDAICPLSTGGGFGTRVLYENDEEMLFCALRPVILNGIEELGSRSDLLDRTMRVGLPTIPEEKRRAEEAIYEQFEEARPRILGALLTAVSTALLVLAAEPSLPWESGAFMNAYRADRHSANDIAIESSPVGEAMLEFATGRDEWTGKASELLGLLDDIVSDKQRTRRAWPKQPHVLSGKLKRLAPNLRAVGVDVIFNERTHEGRSITIRKVALNRIDFLICSIRTCSTTSRNALASSNMRRASRASRPKSGPFATCRHGSTAKFRKDRNEPPRP